MSAPSDTAAFIEINWFDLHFGGACTADVSFLCTGPDQVWCVCFQWSSSSFSLKVFLTIIGIWQILTRLENRCCFQLTSFHASWETNVDEREGPCLQLLCETSLILTEENLWSG